LPHGEYGVVVGGVAVSTNSNYRVRLR